MTATVGPVAAGGPTAPRNAVRASLFARIGSAILVVAICLVAFAVRLHQLAGPLMRWDESWSVALATRTWPEVVAIASWEVHPPVFFMAVKLWLTLGRHVFLVRFFSVLIAVLAVPIAYRVARQWVGRRSVALIAAGLTALAPGLVYYAQVLRMYPLVLLWLLLATWAFLVWLDRGRVWPLVALWAAGTAALYTFYFSAFALLGLYAYGLLACRRRRVRLATTGVLTAAGFVPWLAYAGRGLVERMTTASPAATIMPVTPWDLLVSVWTALTFDLGSSGLGALGVLVVLLVAIAVHRPARRTRRRLLFPLLVMLTTVAGITLGTGFYFFAPRLLTPAMPFLILLVAWALEALLRRSRIVFALAGVVLAIAFWPTSSRFVYQKSLEVSGEFDPHEYYAVLSSRVAPQDLIFFNHLALAGWYEMDRGPQDPPWAYALRWTPIIEPMAHIQTRVEEAAQEHPRLWFVLYKGNFGPGEELKDWLDRTLYPASMDWGTESLFLSYLPPPDGWRDVAPAANFGGLLELEAARFSAAAGAGGEVVVELRWRALDDSLPDLRVVLQAWDETGAVLAQRDVRPANWESPAYRWSAGDVVEENHGLLLIGPSNTPVHLAVSVYDAATGEPLLVGGKTFLELGAIGGGPDG